MSGQLSFAGLDAETMDGLFLAVFPEEDAAAYIPRLTQRLCGEHGLRGRPLESERIHVTLHHLGNYASLPRGLVDAASEAAAAAADMMPPFVVAFDRVMSFSGRPGNRPLVLCGGDGVAGLEMFQQALGTTMKKAGLGRWVEPRFTPHMTLLYGNHSIGEQAVETVGWTVREFVLVHSPYGLTRHIRLGQWPLRG